MRKTHFVAAIAACLMGFSACGDSATPDEGDTTGGGATAGNATQGAATAGAMDGDDAGDATGATGGGETAGNATQGATTGGADAGSTTSGGTDSGATTGSGADAGSSTAGSDDPSTPGNDSSKFVSCGGTPKAELACSLETQSCCVKEFKKGAASCNQGTTCGKDLGTRTPCDGPEDCSGKPCCVDILAGTAKCSAASTCPIASIGKVCHTDADCDASKVCAPGSTFSFWGVCS